MHRLKIYPFSLRLIVYALSAACIWTALASNLASNAVNDCRIGAYRFPNGEIVDIARSEGETLRWRGIDGTTGVLHKKDGSWISTFGWTERPDGHTASFPHCARGEIEFDAKKAHRIPFDVNDTVFEGRRGIKLAGRLVLPKGDDPVPIVVLLHGAERDSAREGTRSNDCYRLRMLASSFMTNGGPADRKANILRISIRSRMTPSPRCGKPGELLFTLCQDWISGRQSGRLGLTARRNTSARRFRYCQFRVGCLRH